MSVISPQAMLLWATLSSTLLLFLVQHLYRYDRFQCLKWRSSSDGGFKRFMTYSYILSVPLIVTYSVAMAVMKYQAGYTSYANPASTPSKPLPRIVIPTPTSMWPESHQKLIFPLYVLFALAWALEIVSHLEELCFWLFMIKEQGEEGEGGIRPWFRSFEYKLWCCGSVGAVVLLPLVTLETRHDVQQVEAWTFFVGSLGSLIITLWFFKVLWKFPDSSYFGRPGEEELPSYVRDQLSEPIRSESYPSSPTTPSPNHPYRHGAAERDPQDDCFATSGPSVIRAASMNSGAPLVNGRPRSRQGLHPLLANFSSPINLFAEDDAQIGRAL